MKLRTRYAIVAATLVCWAGTSAIRAAADRDSFGLALSVFGLACALVSLADALWDDE